ncbi:hypothetical protein ACH5RR_014409 [Cinchona calisaya]|uniref:RING-type domain-containing protein n=1 Tax=Cinchona calisaya TaxID=153742 RepID=A0ABD3A6E4_9GENT
MMQQRGRSLGSTSMSKEDLEKLPCFDFKAKELKGSSRTSSTSPVDCAVCLENFKVGEKCRLLPLCRHSFHAECVDMWLLRTPICPICRASADFTRVAEESNQNGDIGYQLRNYSQMRNESEHFMEAAFETGAGDQPRDDQTVMGSTQSSETGTPANGSYVSETVAMEMRGSQLAAEFEARVHQTV